MTMTKKHDFAALDSLYLDSETVDREIFSEMRSNLLLIAGDHYQRKNSSFFQRVRDQRELANEQRLRLTKNHVGKIVGNVVNTVLSMAPGVGFQPKNAKELQDQKAAELHHAVWVDAKERLGFNELVDDWADDYVGIGEVHTKLFWDETAGELKGYNQKLDPETNEPLFDAQGQPVAGDAVYEGDICAEELYGFNLLRAPEAKSWAKSPYLINRKMASVDLIKEKFPDKKSMIEASQDETFKVFDPGSGSYRNAGKEIMLREYYFRPCSLYPKGYFYLTTKTGILAESELPGGIFPIVSRPYKRVQTSPRGRGPVKTLRPYQAEVNRTASKIAEHQVTLGDDKLILLNGSKVSAGASLPGVRTINAQGSAPVVMEGRTGVQYLDYMNSQITEMYAVMDMQEKPEQISGQIDPYTTLFKAASQKSRYRRQVKGFEFFLRDVAKTYIKLAKFYFDENKFIQVVGRNEQVNISEFKRAGDVGYEIVLDAQSDDIETKLGKQLAINQVLQYSGGKLEKEDIGKLVRLMPYANEEEGLADFTIDYDSATNFILALDRGEAPSVSENDNPDYMIRRLVLRMRQADFKYLEPYIQDNYMMAHKIYLRIKEVQLEKIKAAQNEFIPTGGYLVVCDLYVTDPKDPSKSRRARIPYESINWLIKQLEAQGATLQQLETMNQGSLAQMADMIREKNGQGAPAQLEAPPQEV